LNNINGEVACLHLDVSAKTSSDVYLPAGRQGAQDSYPIAGGRQLNELPHFFEIN